jgi:hypothetical protein
MPADTLKGTSAGIQSKLKYWIPGQARNDKKELLNFCRVHYFISQSSAAEPPRNSVRRH